MHTYTSPSCKAHYLRILLICLQLRWRRNSKTRDGIAPISFGLQRKYQHATPRTAEIGRKDHMRTNMCFDALENGIVGSPSCSRRGVQRMQCWHYSGKAMEPGWAAFVCYGARTLSLTSAHRGRRFCCNYRKDGPRAHGNR